ncbi:prepilin-type N-terminal cleavage/methylation domain-containing protein [Photobacterium lucens]|uniref:prepilin-type N-terminal cleavage/methylation domain-containing protein n=1 Tax=Photobacterium lucens TaxID=2562949 RepID=UPI0006B62542|nr:prepilin-type N-terminal cleavage/methylation domain-containing protein [Photobacterium lucens]KPA52824.1 MSHA biogenesis protein MshA [Photobacterium leiognathi subsp. mandapamensis]MBP2700513.1 prepilin-type N-terminal cleavage/methylation domain-containing protein [Vibrio parahaemolyticus]MZG57097.1 prepilin-type N-terminal cleavage/methylation domain-containing protein [Photobacterium lucens]MZG80794.1 prepilin-type N-terminal cleavage/methylation domain-containing protein [Photobacteriu
MNKQKGFTLIELVVVIVILGILAVTAAPKFLNLQGDARKASLQGLKGAIDGAAGITYGRAAVDGVEAVSSSTTTKGGVPVAYGFPKATSAALSKVVTGLNEDWKVVASVDNTSISYSYKSNNTTDKCIVTYTQATGVSSPATTQVTLGPDCAGE